MYSVALYNSRQHKQLVLHGEQLTLRETLPGSGLWVLTDDEAATGPGLLRIDFEGESIQIQSEERAESSDASHPLAAGKSYCLPIRFRVGETWFEVAGHQQARQLVPLNQEEFEKDFAASCSSDSPAGPSAATVTKWLGAVGQLHRSAAGSSAFYDDAARFAVETVGLDAAWILRPNEEPTLPWRIVGSAIPHPEQGILYDLSAVCQMAEQATTWFQPASSNPSFLCDDAIVVAPARDEQGETVAMIYGVRHTAGNNRRRGIRPLEARLIQLLADSVAVGIARLQRETEATRTRVLLEHAFSPTVAEYIQQHPASLTGQSREVTLMFADLRGYTSLAETLDPGDCYQLLGDVMETLTQVVKQHRGILVDYYGDGLLALWNAPVEQPDHADLACGAALKMFDAMPAVSEQWKQQLDAPLQLGIGIHTGPAHVGNAGTRSRIKYGPRGNAVNVASRVQSASKQLELPLVITATTQTKLSPAFFTLRVCTAKLPGLEKPTQLFTVYPATEARQLKQRLDDYSHALELYESGDLEAAEALLGRLTALGPVTPAQFLAHYTAAQQKGNLGRRAVDKYSASSGPVIEILSK